MDRPPAVIMRLKASCAKSFLFKTHRNSPRNMPQSFAPFIQWDWAYPWAFVLLPLFLAAWFMKKRSQEGRFFYSSLRLLQGGGGRSLKERFHNLSRILCGAGLVFIIAALARPRVPAAAAQQTVHGIDILLALDISLSMLAPDMGGGMTRLESAKQVLKNFISQRPHDRKGLIVFSGESHTLSPLTLDSNFLQKQLEGAEVTEHLKGGTAIGVALAHSAARMRHSPLKSRILIFLTDGENNTGFIDPSTALSFLKTEGVKVYTVALGRLKKGRIAVQIPFKGPGGKRHQTAYIDTSVNEGLLKEMAQKTDGRFFKAEDKDALQKIFLEIDSLEKQVLPEKEQAVYQELFHLPLGLGIWIYLLGVFMSVSWLFRAV